MRIIDIALKDLRQISRERQSAFFLLVMPLAFTLFFGFIFNQSAQENSLAIALINQDPAGVLSGKIQSALENLDGIEVVQKDYSPESASAAVRSQKLAAVVIVPEDYTLRILAGEPLPLKLVVEPGSSAGQSAITAIQAAIKPVLGSAEAAQISANVYASMQPFASEADRQAFLVEGLDLAGAAWQQAPFAISAQATGGASKSASNSFAQPSPGMIVQFVVFGLVTSAMLLVLERKSGTFDRMLATSISRASVIAGHVLAMFTVVFIQELLLVAAGQFFFGVDYLREPLGTLLIITSLALWSASLGLLIGVFVKGEEQVILWALVAMFLLSALGGAWFPLDVSGKVFNTIGHLTPTAWAMDGFQNIVLRGLGFSSLLLPAAVLLAYALGFFTLAVWKFSRAN